MKITNELNHHFIIEDVFGTELADIKFQEGPVKEEGTNGIQDIDLFKILIARQEYFQGTKYACKENESTLYHLREALTFQLKRTSKRERESIEGTSEV